MSTPPLCASASLRETLWPQLVAVVGEEYLRDHVPLETHEESIEQIQDHLNWLEINQDENDTINARLQNLACLVAAAERYAVFLLTLLPPGEIQHLLAEYATPAAPTTA